MSRARTPAEVALWANIPRSLASLVCTVAERHGITMAAMRGDSRAHRFVVARRELAQEATAAGFGSPTIGRALNRDHSTVLHHLKTAA